MIYAICIGKRKENNVIVEYKLKDFSNKTMVVTAEELKDFIRNGKLTVVNLTLTSNNKLVDSGLKDLDLLKKKNKVVKTREENIDSIIENSRAINIKDRDNSCIYENKLFFVDKHDMLCVIDVAKNTNKGICENVFSVSYVPIGRRMNIFVVYEHMDKFRLKRLLYDLDEDKLVLSYHLWFLDDGATIGHKAKMTNIGFDKIEERPDYYVADYKSQFDYVILPIKRKISNGYIITEIVIYDIKGEHFYRARSNVKYFDDFVNMLNENSYYVVPFSTVSNTGIKITIQTLNKMVVTLIYNESRIEFYKN
jgi:hypothetical protein